jgi:hypothetical protein
MWTAPHVNCQLRHPQRYAVTLDHALRHSALQSGRRTGTGSSRSRRSVSALHGVLHSIGGCSFCLIDIPFRMDDDLSGQRAQVNLLRSNGRAWGTTFGTASGVGTSGSWHDPIAAVAIPVSDGIWRCQIEKAHLAHDTSSRHVVPQETAMPAAADPTGHGARHSYDR